MRVALFGGTGFVGSYLVDALLERNHHPVVLVRPGSEAMLRQPERCTVVPGRIADPDAVRQALEGVEATIYNIGILREFPDRGITFRALHYDGARLAMELAQASGAERFLLMSANGVREDGTEYQRTKYQAEQYLQSTGLQWTIFRPSVIFGDPRGHRELATQLYGDLVATPLPAPLFHEGLLPFRAGAMEMSPVHVRDVAAVFAESLQTDASIGRTIPLGGPRRLSWKEILETIARATGRYAFGLPAPVWAVKLAAGLFERFEFFPVTRDQISMLMEGNTCDSSAVFSDFGIQPTPFDEEHLAYLLRRQGEH
jgi:uncharacterized protein YbjT (DUF2867 family)